MRVSVRDTSARLRKLWSTKHADRCVRALRITVQIPARESAKMNSQWQSFCLE